MIAPTRILFSSLILSALPSGAVALTLDAVGRYGAEIFDESAAEIVAFDPPSKRLFVTNSNSSEIDILDIADPSAPGLVTSLPLEFFGDGPTSCAVYKGVLAVTVPAKTKQNPGKVVFFNTEDYTFLSYVDVGALPDSLAFTPDGTKVVVANEGEPDDDYEIDPEGSVSIIDLTPGVENITTANVATADFTQYNGKEDMLRSNGVRVFGPGASAAQDFEPEFVAISPDSSTAFVSLQENNALAIIDLATAEVKSVEPFGYKIHFNRENGMDASNRDDVIDIRSRQVFGMYQPDGIACYEVQGKTYVITANEGDARDYDGFSEERRIKDFNGEADGDDGVIRVVDPSLLNRFPDLLEDEELGRLRTTTASPFGVKVNEDGVEISQSLFSYGARSFSIWTENGRQVYDSADELEQLTAELVPDIFNSNNDETEADGRSDDKGPEPEAVTTGEIGGVTYAFIALERVGGIMVYDVSDPKAPAFITYASTRLMADDEDAETPEDDLGPEGLIFISAEDSPNEKPLLVVAHEVSGSTVIFEINE